MIPIRKILCAVDFSDINSIIAEYAKYLAKAIKADLVVVYVVPSLSQYVGFHVPNSSIENFVSEIVSGAESTMEAYLKENFIDFKVTGKVVIGCVAEKIISVAETENVDLVIMGTHGRKGINRILFGSVAEKVVKGSPWPVITIRPEIYPAY
ncbi:Universal stress protein [Desulfovibrionales bacterium]